MSLHASSDGSRLLTVHGFDEMAEPWIRAPSSRTTSRSTNDFTSCPPRPAHHHPDGERPAGAPPPRYRRCPLPLQGEPLIATSPPAPGKRGQTMQHRVVAWSKKGGLSYELVAGPEGMNVAPDGTLTWNVPRRHRSDEVTAVSQGAGRDRTGRLP